MSDKIIFFFVFFFFFVWPASVLVGDSIVRPSVFCVEYLKGRIKQNV